MFARLSFRAATLAARNYSTASLARAVGTPRAGASLVLGFSGAAILGLSLSSVSAIESDARTDVVSAADSVSVDPSIDPFKLALTRAGQPNLHSDFQLLGHGMRSVTFLAINVYGIGLYVSSADVPTIKKVIGASSDSVAELTSTDKSVAFVGELLDAKVRFAARICPVRNTDFTHLKDGLVKSVLAHLLAKAGSPVREDVGKGLEQLRDVFSGHKGSVPKNHVLWLEILGDGKLSISYENTKTNTLKTLGAVEEPLVGKVLFLQYMSGRKPLSEPLRKSCAQGYEAI